MRAKLNHEENYIFYVLHNDGTLVEKKGQSSCNHYDTDLMPICILVNEYIALSCLQCNNIRIVDLDKGASSLAYADSASEIRAICNGPNGTLYSVGHSSLSGSEVSILDCSQVQFVLLQKYPVIPDFKANNICYLRSSGKIYLGSENESKICAIDREPIHQRVLGSGWNIRANTPNSKSRWIRVHQRGTCT